MKIKKLKQRKILIIGAGGIGSYLASFLERISEQRQPLYDLTIFDDDKVEEKNLSYQNFTVEDIGKHKVTVIGSNIGIKPAISERKEYRVLVSQQLKKYDLVICCVDNLATRRLLYLEGHGEECPVKWLDLRAQGRNGVLICQGGDWDGSAKDINTMHIVMAGIASQWVQRWFNDNNDVADKMVVNV